MIISLNDYIKLREDKYAEDIIGVRNFAEDTSLDILDNCFLITIANLPLSTFNSTGMDGIAIGNYLLLKGDG
jgi:hypothetical protein